MLSVCLNPSLFPPSGSPALGPAEGLPANRFCMVLRRKKTFQSLGMIASHGDIGMSTVMVERLAYLSNHGTYVLSLLAHEASDSLRRFHALRMPSGGPTTASLERYLRFPELRNMATYSGHPTGVVLVWSVRPLQTSLRRHPSLPWESLPPIGLSQRKTGDFFF